MKEPWTKCHPLLLKSHRIGRRNLRNDKRRQYHHHDYHNQSASIKQQNDPLIVR